MGPKTVYRIYTHAWTHARTHARMSGFTIFSIIHACTRFWMHACGTHTHTLTRSWSVNIETESSTPQFCGSYSLLMRFCCALATHAVNICIWLRRVVCVLLWVLKFTRRIFHLFLSWRTRTCGFFCVVRSLFVLFAVPLTAWCSGAF